MIHDNVIYKDNQSAIKLEKNGRQSSSKRKRHIHTRNYFINDRILNQEAFVEFCPTIDMIGYFLPKLLKVYQLHRFRNIIFGINEDDILAYNTSRRALLEEKNKN